MCEMMKMPRPREESEGLQIQNFSPSSSLSWRSVKACMNARYSLGKTNVIGRKSKILP
jgi:hypothetical protein